MRVWLSGKASPSQGEDHGFESRHPLQNVTTPGFQASVAQW